MAGTRRRATRVVAVLAAALAVGALTVSPWVRPGTGGTDDARAQERRTVAPLRDGEVLDTIGVVSYNVLRHLDARRARKDWERMTSVPGVDLIGWQESQSAQWERVYPDFRAKGWETWFWPERLTGPQALAVTWRTATFELIGVDFRKMHDGGYRDVTDHPFPTRWVVLARLRHRASGRTVTLVNTHVNQHIETGRRFERNENARRAKAHLRTLARMWDTVPGSVVLGTGDYNFDHRDDAAARPRGGITRVFRGRATSSYQALGLEGIQPTREGRWIDYVFLADRSGRRAQFARHRVLPGFNSDHSPLLARVRLYE